MSGVAVVILAAGMGSRMKSALPKTLHQVAGKPLLAHVLRAAQQLDPERVIVVIGHGGQQVTEAMRGQNITFVQQCEQLGTGHALLQTEDALAGYAGDVFVLNGDGPLIRGETLQELLAFHRAQHAGMTIATSHVPNPTGLGRIVRGADGTVTSIVEEKDASEDERAIQEINPGLYLFNRNMFARAQHLTNDNAAGEYYITDLVAHYRAAGESVGALVVPDASELFGINDRAELARAEHILQERYRAQWLAAGVTMIAPETVFLGPDVALANDVVLEPGVIISGSTTIGAEATIGAYSVLVNTSVPPRARILPHTLEIEP